MNATKNNSPSYGTNDPKGWCGDPKRGAALGRATINKSEIETFNTPLTLRRVRLDSGGYDSNGTYFGIGQPLFWCASNDGTVDMTFRAANRNEAKSIMLRKCHQAKFYR